VLLRFLSGCFLYGLHCGVLMVVVGGVLGKYRAAGRIAAVVREQLRLFVREGMSVIDVCERAEALIKEKGGFPAFPCNISVNEVAAHYTSSPNDTRVIPAGSLVKIDVGVHVDGYIADTAVTVCFDPEYEFLARVAREALDTAIGLLRPGLPVSRFGAAVEKFIASRGCKVVSNLTGHQLGRFLVHAGKSLPNVSHLSTAKILVGEVYAVEPFVTVPEAAGRIVYGKEAYIFRFQKNKSLKNLYAKKLLDYISENFRTLPFTERWLQKVAPQEYYRAAFSELLSSRALISYPVFVEASGKPVAQAEHTVLITRDGCEVLT
jgi:methionyl aminopeptidase